MGRVHDFFVAFLRRTFSQRLLDSNLLEFEDSALRSPAYNVDEMYVGARCASPSERCTQSGVVGCL
jgi:hypothetical protein